MPYTQSYVLRLPYVADILIVGILLHHMLSFRVSVAVWGGGVGAPGPRSPSRGQSWRWPLPILGRREFPPSSPPWLPLLCAEACCPGYRGRGRGRVPIAPREPGVLRAHPCCPTLPPPLLTVHQPRGVRMTAALGMLPWCSQGGCRLPTCLLTFSPSPP